MVLGERVERVERDRRRGAREPGDGAEEGLRIG